MKSNELLTTCKLYRDNIMHIRKEGSEDGIIVFYTNKYCVVISDTKSIGLHEPLILLVKSSESPYNDFLHVIGKMTMKSSSSKYFTQPLTLHLSNGSFNTDDENEIKDIIGESMYAKITVDVMMQKDNSFNNIQSRRMKLSGVTREDLCKMNNDISLKECQMMAMRFSGFDNTLKNLINKGEKISKDEFMNAFVSCGPKFQDEPISRKEFNGEVISKWFLYIKTKQKQDDTEKTFSETFLRTVLDALKDHLDTISDPIDRIKFICDVAHETGQMKVMRNCCFFDAEIINYVEKYGFDVKVAKTVDLYDIYLSLYKKFPDIISKEEITKKLMNDIL